MAEPEVFVFSSPDCPYCKRAKEYLSGKGVKYTNLDISSDQKIYKEMLAVSGQDHIPVLVIKGRVIVGFEPALIDQALSMHPLPKREEAIKNIIFDPFERF